MEMSTILNIIVEILLAGAAAYYYKHFKSAKKDVDLLIEDNELLRKTIIKQDTQWFNELTAAQVTIDNLKTRLEDTKSVSESKEIVIEDVAKPKRKRNTKK